MSGLRPRVLVILAAVAALALVAFVRLQPGPATASPSAAPAALAPVAASPAGAGLRGPSVRPDDHHDTSPPIRTLPPAAGGTREENDEGALPHPKTVAGAVDTVVQATMPALSIPAATTSFDGVGQGFTGPAGTFTVNAAPPDTNGDVGPNHYVQVVNTDFAVFGKTGLVLYGPVPINTIWSGFGGGCQANNDGDPTVKYDRMADRWIITQFSVSTTPYLECVAVSTTPDPTGSYYRYAFSYGTSTFPDYPKLAVWPDAFYVTFNDFNASGTAFLGGRACAYDRARMLLGQAATQQCFDTSALYGGLLPSDLDGSRLPPAGSPDYVVALGAVTNQLATWKFHVDWASPASSTFTGPAALTTAAYAEACNGGTCIPQSGTSQKLDSLADRLMYRLAYRNFGDHEALVVNHSVTAGSSVGIRWYELRPDGAQNLSIFQQGTYAPDASYRWMGSIAQDQAGDTALGFSLSASTLKPEIHYTGRLAGDPLGQMAQGEQTIIAGGGVQTGSSLSRWGDYSSLAVDPADDCTFWYTTEYIPANGAFNWRTRIASFRFPGCGVATANDFSISASPASLAVAAGSTGTSTISTTLVSGSAETVSFAASGVPAGVTASFSPASVTAGGSSTLTLTAAASASSSSSTVTITGTAASATHATTVALTVTAASTANDFSISASPASLSLAQGASGSSTISTGLVSGSAETVALVVAGVPAGATASLNPASVTTGGSATLTIGAGTAAPGTYPLTITGTAASATHATTVSLTVTAAAGVPGAPVLTATRTSRRGVQLTWTVPASNGSPITGYRIYRGNTSGTEVFLIARSAGATSYRDTATVSGTTYYYRITASNAIGEGPFSNEASARAR